MLCTAIKKTQKLLTGIILRDMMYCVTRGIVPPAAQKGDHNNGRSVKARSFGRLRSVRHQG